MENISSFYPTDAVPNTEVCNLIATCTQTLQVVLQVLANLPQPPVPTGGCGKRKLVPLPPFPGVSSELSLFSLRVLKVIKKLTENRNGYLVARSDIMRSTHIKARELQRALDELIVLGLIERGCPQPLIARYYVKAAEWWSLTAAGVKYCVKEYK